MEATYLGYGDDLLEQGNPICIFGEWDTDGQDYSYKGDQTRWPDIPLLIFDLCGGVELIIGKGGLIGCFGGGSYVEEGSSIKPSIFYWW